MECKSGHAKRRWLLRKSGERMDDTLPRIFCYNFTPDSSSFVLDK